MSEHLRKTVPCPCCKGTERLKAVDADQPSGIVVLRCLHCDGGVVPVDESPFVQNNFEIVIAPGLQRGEMKPDEKREHLRSMGMKIEADIEKIISEIFP